MKLVWYRDVGICGVVLNKIWGNGGKLVKMVKHALCAVVHAVDYTNGILLSGVMLTGNFSIIVIAMTTL